MRVDWYGQAAFHLTGREGSVFIDPLGDISGLSSRGIQFDYPAIAGVDANLLLVTHEHADHNGVEAIGGDPTVLRSTAGRLESPFGEVVAIASEHDEAAGTERGPNTIFVFGFDGLRIAHFGDFGQRALRDEQANAVGTVDLMFLPVGGGPTIGAEQAAAIVELLHPRWVVPMHYRTPRIGFLEPADAFLERMPHVQRLEETGFDTNSIAGDEPLVVVPSAP
ncbi:MAG: MBL fold metallo-hydrolase [Solirubrobacterales bacterium]|nr:MBL fold metallo-hydrolase [Solirubrobacterales bacterium]